MAQLSREQCQEELAKMQTEISEIFKQTHNIPLMLRLRKDGHWAELIFGEPPVEAKRIIEQIMVSAARKGAEAICQIAESWTLSQEWHHTHKDYPDIQSNPHRTEMLHISFEAPGYAGIAHALILRDQDEPRLGDWSVVDDPEMKLSGRLCGTYDKAAGKTPISSSQEGADGHMHTKDPPATRPPFWSQSFNN